MSEDWKMEVRGMRRLSGEERGRERETLFLSRQPSPNGLESKLVFLTVISCEESC